jgi:hypothetical protein
LYNTDIFSAICHKWSLLQKAAHSPPLK